MRMPTPCQTIAPFFVDTYDSIAGIRHAVEVGKRLRKHGHKLAGIRLDSGDLAYLSIQARKILNAGGFKDAVIVGSNDLNEHLIASLKQQGAAINLWGVEQSCWSPPTINRLWAAFTNFPPSVIPTEPGTTNSSYRNKRRK